MRNKRNGPHDGGPYYYVAPWRTRQTPKAPSETPWCKKEMVSLPIEVGFGKYRCPDCGKLLQVMSVDIENGYGWFRPYMPPHKRKSLETVKNKAHARRAKKKSRHRNIRGK